MPLPAPALTPSIPKSRKTGGYWRRTSRFAGAPGAPRRVGLAGGQGAGKSTLSRAIIAAGEALRASRRLPFHRRLLPHAFRTRRRWRRASIPCWRRADRRVPTTFRFCMSVMDALDADGIVTVPIFDKGLDDRRAANAQRAGPGRRRSARGLVHRRAAGAPGPARSTVSMPLKPSRTPKAYGGRHINQALATDYARLFGKFGLPRFPSGAET